MCQKFKWKDRRKRSQGNSLHLIKNIIIAEVAE